MGGKNEAIVGGEKARRDRTKQKGRETGPIQFTNLVLFFKNVFYQIRFIKHQSINVFSDSLRLVDHVDGNAVVVPAGLFHAVRGPPRL